MQDANKNRLYVHEVFVSDKIEKSDTLQTAASKPHGGIALYRDILANVLEVKSEGKGNTLLSDKQETGGKSSVQLAEEDDDWLDEEPIEDRLAYAEKMFDKAILHKNAIDKGRQRILNDSEGKAAYEETTARLENEESGHPAMWYENDEKSAFEDVWKSDLTVSNLTKSQGITDLDMKKEGMLMAKWDFYTRRSGKNSLEALIKTTAKEVDNIRKKSSSSIQAEQADASVTGTRAGGTLQAESRVESGESRVERLKEAFEVSRALEEVHFRAVDLDWANGEFGELSDAEIDELFKEAKKKEREVAERFLEIAKTLNDEELRELMRDKTCMLQLRGLAPFRLRERMIIIERIEAAREAYERLNDPEEKGGVARNKKFDLYEAVDPASNHPTWRGVQHIKERRMAVGTDGVVLIASADAYDPKFDGKTVKKNGEVADGWAALDSNIGKLTNLKEPVVATIKVTQDKATKMGSLVRNLNAGGKKEKIVTVRYSENGYGLYRAKQLNTAIRAAMELGVDELKVYGHGIMIGTSSKGMVLVCGMPESEKIDGRIDLSDRQGNDKPGNGVNGGDVKLSAGGNENGNAALSEPDAEYGGLFATRPMRQSAVRFPRNLFDSAQSTMHNAQSNLPSAAASAQLGSEARAEEANMRIDDFTERVDGIYGRYGLYAKERPELTEELMARMDGEIRQEAERLRGHLEEYYLGEGNTKEDSKRMSRDMAMRVMAEATLSLSRKAQREIGIARLERIPGEPEEGTERMVTAGGEILEFNSQSTIISGEINIF